MSKFWPLATFLVLLAVTTVHAQVPMGVIAEDCTATWCTYCPNAYAGLEVMKQRYDTTEFNSVRYYATSGGLGTAETNARISYYGVTGYPTVLFQGTTRLVGAGADYQDGHVYDPVVASLIGLPSSFKITINSLDLIGPDGSVDFDVEVADDVADIGNVKIRALVLENNVPYGSEVHTDVTRDVLPDAILSVSQLGEVQNVYQSFTIDPTWKPQDLWVAIFIQDDDTKAILQSGSSRPAPTYSMRYWAQGVRGAVTGSRALLEFDDFAVFNYGTNPDVIRITMDGASMPAGWTCAFSDGSNDYTDYLDVALDPGQFQIFHLKVTTSGPGYAQPRIVLTSENLPSTVREIQYQVVTNDLDVLLVDDDGADTFEEYHMAALEAAGRTYGIWSTNIADVTTEIVTPFDVIDWQIGLSYPTLTDSDRAALGAWLDDGGNLFITGQDLGWEMNDQGGAAIAWYRQYLHANYVGDDANRNLLTGVSGDPISAGMTLNLSGGDGANNNIYPEMISAYDSYATTIFSYDGLSPTRWGALRADNGVSKVVYLGIPYESINNAADRALLMSRALDWFAGVSGAEESGAGAGMVVAFPNPAPGSTTLRLVLPSSGPVRLAVFSPDGRLVRTLASGHRPAGTHELTWDGRDEAGRSVPSGIYLYRLEADGATPRGKLVLMR